MSKTKLFVFVDDETNLPQNKIDYRCIRVVVYSDHYIAKYIEGFVTGALMRTPFDVLMTPPKIEDETKRQ